VLGVKKNQPDMMIPGIPAAFNVCGARAGIFDPEMGKMEDRRKDIPAK